jgi:small-conductance mechanosensitive channel
LRDILDNYEAVLKRPEPLIHIGRLGDSSVSMMVKPWVRTQDYWTAQRFITREIKRRFDEEGISIPFPQRDVHIYYEQGNAPTGGARNDQTLRPAARPGSAKQDRPEPPSREPQGKKGN